MVTRRLSTCIMVVILALGFLIGMGATVARHFVEFGVQGGVKSLIVATLVVSLVALYAYGSYSRDQ